MLNSSMTRAIFGSAAADSIRHELWARIGSAVRRRIGTLPEDATTGQYTLNYGLGGNPNSIKPEFLLGGNAAMGHRYGGGYPWRQQTGFLASLPK
jgi:hypothetical protein